MPDTLSSKLSPRELECLRGVSEHKRSSQIGFELGLQAKTVDAYVASAMKKLGVSDRDSAVRALLTEAPGLWGNSPSTFPEVEGPDEPVSQPASRLPWPFPTSGRPVNDLNALSTYVAIAIAASLMLAAASLFLLAVRMVGEQF